MSFIKSKTARELPITGIGQVYFPRLFSFNGKQCHKSLVKQRTGKISVSCSFYTGVAAIDL